MSKPKHTGRPTGRWGAAAIATLAVLGGCTRPVAPGAAAGARPSHPGAEHPPGPALAAQPAEGAWHAAAALPVEIAEIAAATLDGAIYTGGGFTPPGGTTSTWFGRYDVAADRWEARAPLPMGVHHPGMAATAGRVWLAGGYPGALSAAAASNQLYAYDPATDSWHRMADMPGRRAAHGMAALGGRLYVAGGVGDAEDRLWVYDPATDRWHDLPGPTPREHLGVTATTDRLYVIAGRGFGRGIVGTLEVFDPATGTWERLPDMPRGCGGCAAAATADGRLHITGGEGGGRTYGDHAVYDPAHARWRWAEPLPVPRHGIGAAAWGERFYVIGGGRRQGLDYSNLVDWWAPVAAPPSPTSSPTSPAASLFAPILAQRWPYRAP